MRVIGRILRGSCFREARDSSTEMSSTVPDQGKISTISAAADGADGSTDVQGAISTTGYGKFNVLLVLAILPIAWAGLFDVTTPAFIIASAECDLGLTFFRKGVLVAFPYVAMAVTSSLWDYATPWIGKRNLFVLALLADSVLNLLSTAVDSFYVFLLIKFLSGVLAGGPLSMTMSYLSEFHSTRYAATFGRWMGLLIAVGNIVPAGIAFTVLPLSWDVEVFGRRYTAWRVYLLICSLVPICGLVTSCTLPESPKFLLEAGKTGRAVKLLRTMYSWNKGKPADEFPFKIVRATGTDAPERPTIKHSLERMRRDLYNAKLLFSRPYLSALSSLCTLQFVAILGFNTMRLWVPHLFVILNNFDGERWNVTTAPTMCQMLDRRAGIPARPYLRCSGFDDVCLTWKINAIIYFNSTVIATSAVLFSFFAAFITTTKFRKKAILGAALLVAALSSFGANWAQTPLYMLTLSAAIIVTARIAGNTVTATNADVIPVPLRTTSLGILTTVGNVATVVGNLVFSALLGVECLAAFFAMGCLFLCCLCLSIVRPKPTSNDPNLPAAP